MVFLNLAAGLDRLGVPYRVNDYRHARRNPEELVCIVGKPHVLLDREWRNPVLFGASVFSHPLECPDLFERFDVRRVLVPGEWMAEMFREHYPAEKVTAWPVGIDTDRWRPAAGMKTLDVLVYDKLRWDRDVQVPAVLDPVRDGLRRRGLSFEEVRYGSYEPAELEEKLGRARGVVFICEHETQGLAYQQMLSAGVPVFAWDRGGPWTDPSYYPEKVRFGPVSSVPYFDGRCGATFADAAEFEGRFDEFWFSVGAGGFDPRLFVLEKMTLEKCASAYVRVVEEIVGR